MGDTAAERGFLLLTPAEEREVDAIVDGFGVVGYLREYGYEVVRRPRSTNSEEVARG